jgi:hypothetical protein
MQNQAFGLAPRIAAGWPHIVEWEAGDQSAGLSGHILERERVLRRHHLDQVNDVLKGADRRSHANRVTLCDPAQRPEKCIAVTQHHDIADLAGNSARRQMSNRLA